MSLYERSGNIQPNVYGTIVEDKFRIIDLRDVKGKIDRRRIPRGRICSSIARSKLYDLLYYLGIPSPKIKGEVPSLQEMQNLSQDDIENPTNDKIQYVYAWNQSNSTKKEMCDILYEHLLANGLMH
jgi:hypothetical protein